MCVHTHPLITDALRICLGLWRSLLVYARHHYRAHLKNEDLKFISKIIISQPIIMLV